MSWIIGIALIITSPELGGGTIAFLAMSLAAIWPIAIIVAILTYKKSP
jgi:hypothetical protein